MSIGTIHRLLRANVNGNVKEELRNTTGRSMMWGVFKAYVGFFKAIFLWVKNRFLDLPLLTSAANNTLCTDLSPELLATST